MSGDPDDRDLDFATFAVRDLESVAGLFNPDDGLRGIYVLHFADGTAYVGQTLNIWSRYAAHRRTYPDLEHLEFARVVGDRDLDALEIAEIRFRARTRELRNVTHYLPSQNRPSKLDPIVPLAHQLAFQDGDGQDDITDRAVTPEQREQGRKAFERLRKNPLARVAGELAAQYIARTIPSPRATERRFWALSAAPSTNAGNRLFCFSINKPETFVLFDMGDGTVYGFLNVSRTALVDSYGSLARFASLHDDWIFVDEDAGYEACGGDALRLCIDGDRDLRRLFDDQDNDGIVRSARVMNLALMRKGPTFQAKGHNVPFADTLLEDPPAIPHRLTRVPGPAHRRRPVSDVPGVPSPTQPYRAFESPLPHLVDDDVKRTDALAALVSVLSEEGPATGVRVHQVFSRAAGAARVGSRWRDAVNSLLALSVRRGLVLQDAPLRERAIADRTYRLPEQPPVRIRTLGPRTFQQIPPRELAAVLDHVVARTTGPDDVIARAVAAHYGVSRLGPTIRARISMASTLGESGQLTL